MMNPSASETTSESVDIKEYLAILLKRKWLILVCFLLSMAGTTAFLFTRQPIYRANAKMLVTVSGGVLPSAEVRSEEGGSFYATQIDIMLSQTMLKRVQLRMKKSADEIRENLTNLKVSPVRGSDIILVTVDSPSGDFAHDFANALCDEYLRFRDEERARTSESALLMLTREINRLSQEVKAAQERYLVYAKENNLPMLQRTGEAWWRSYYIALADQNRNIDKLVSARARMDALERPTPSAYIALLSQARSSTVDESANLKSAAGQPNDNQVAIDSQARTASPPSSTQLDAPENQPSGSPATDESHTGPPLATNTNPVPSPSLNEKSSPTQTAIAENAGAQLSPEQSVGSAYPGLPATLLNGLISLELRKVTLEARVEELSKLYRPLHPALVATRQELHDVVQQIQFQMKFAREITKSEVETDERDVALSNEKLDKFAAGALAKSTAILQGTSMNDDVERVRSQYNALLGQLMKIDVAQGFKYRTVSVLEPAILETDPVYPKKVRGLLVAAFFGLGLGLALAFFIEYIDDSIKLAEEVERDLQLPFLGMVPAAQWNPDDLSAHRLDRLKQQGGVAEAYRVVRSAIIFSIPREKLRSILMTSAVPREGKTTSCVNLSIGFAQIEERVLLVDADLRRGEIHKYFGFEKDKGLADILLGEVTPEEVVKHTDVPKLDVITVGAYPANPAELLLGWRLKEFLDWAYKHYDRVIIDCTPVMGIADSAILGSAVDGVLFVIWAGRTSRRYVRVAKMTAVSRGAKVFGFVLNNLEPGRVGYYHYYPYYYSYYSRGYYYAHKEEGDETKGGDIKGIEVPSPKEGQDEIDDVY
jgi:capsular exopolysaccharide synthesis family protein